MDTNKYDHQSQEYFHNGKEDYKKGYITFENVLIFSQIVLGSIILYPLKYAHIPFVSIIYVLFVVIMLAFVLRKHLCTHCYYYGKNCHCGWGKLSSALYNVRSGKYKFGGKLAALTWGISILLPLIAIPFLLYFELSYIQNTAYLYILFLAVVAINGYFHAKDCKDCKMRYICPGSAAKKQKNG